MLMVVDPSAQIARLIAYGFSADDVSNFAGLAERPELALGYGQKLGRLGFGEKGFN